MSPVFSHVEPIFPVRDIPQAIQYWKDVLGFENQWTWGDPPSHGGVAWQKAFVQFVRNPELAAVSKGNAIWIRLRHIEALYALHQRNKAEIVAPLELHDYGMAQYSVREINGYYVHFAGEPAERSGHGAGRPGHTVRIVERKPSAEEYQLLQTPGGASDITVVAEDAVTGEIVGCASALGDQAGSYFVKDVVVRQDWQGRGVGTALMKELMQRLESRITVPVLVGLFARESLEPFYQQFGFLASFGMVKEIEPGSR